MTENDLANALCQLVNQHKPEHGPIPAFNNVEVSAWGTLDRNGDSGGHIEVIDSNGNKDDYYFVLVKQQR